ncbi:MAG: NAD-dependent epimerase/dehydratase family protein [Gemmatimonadales bacterium]
MRPRALVTGASGMLGRYTAEVLLERGWSVRALVRSRAAHETLRERGLEPVEGHLEDAHTLIQAARGCSAVFHAAAVIGASSDAASFRAANVSGTGNVVEAAASAGARLVHVSSTAVYGRARYGATPTDEDTPLPELPGEDAYGRSKQEAEAVVMEACRAGRVWATVVRPPVMYGIGDRQLAPRLGPVLMQGLFPLIGGGGTTLTFVHARNVAEGVVLAAERDEACGKVFLLSDDFPLTVAAFVQGASRGLGKRIFTPTVAPLVGRWGFALLGLGLSAAGRRDLVRHARGTLEMLTRDNPFTSQRARAVLGWRPSVTPAEGLAEAFAWWRRTSHPRGGR